MLGQSVGGGVEGHGHGSDRAVCAREGVWVAGCSAVAPYDVSRELGKERGRVGEDACAFVPCA